MSQLVKISQEANVIVNPLGFTAGEHYEPAPRLKTLKGVTIGLLDNAKPRADVILSLAKEFLEAEGANVTIYEFKPQLSKPLPIEQIENLAKADAVVGALGDCGSCSTGLAKDAVALEKRGVPTATVYTPIFGSSAYFNALGQGLPDLPITFINTPTGLAGDLPEDAIREYTKPILKEIKEILTLQDTDELKRKYSAANNVKGGIKVELEREVQVEKKVEIEIPAAKDPIIINKDPDADALLEYLESNHASDGLPVVPPTKERVARMLEHSLLDPDEEILKIPPRNGILTPRRLAANAVMAGCKPEYYPILETAFKAMKAPEFNLGGAVTTTGEVWPSIIVSGPYAKKIGMESGFGLFGPGNRANITIGRTITLVLFGIGGAIPGVGSFATFGNMTRRGLAFSEDSDSPWSSYHEEKGYPDQTTVTVATTINPSLMVDESELSENILYLISKHIALPGTRGDYNPGEFIIVLNPSHRQRLARDGWTKEDIKQFFYENARAPFNLLNVAGTQIGRKRWPKWVYGNPYDGQVPFLRNPEDAIILSGGGPVAAHSAIFSTWLGNSKTQTVPLELPPIDR